MHEQRRGERSVSENDYPARRRCKRVTSGAPRVLPARDEHSVSRCSSDEQRMSVCGRARARAYDIDIGIVGTVQLHNSPQVPRRSVENCAHSEAILATTRSVLVESAAPPRRRNEQS